MAWDTEAATQAANVIAKVEGAGAWDAINYNDPITVGLMQWFGTRAASLLKNMKDNGTWSTDSVLANLNTSLENTSTSSRWWTSRYLTGGEGKALKPVLRANKDIQSATVVSDMNDYRDVASAWGMNPDTGTKAVQFFCVMYHQSPRQASRVVKSVGGTSSLDRIYAACMNNKVLRQYRTRYTSAYNMIKNNNWPTIIDLNDDDAPITDGGNGHDDPGDESQNTGEKIKGVIKYLAIVGDQIAVTDKDDKVWFARPTVPNHYVVQVDNSGAGVDIPDTPEDTGQPDPPPFEGDITAGQRTLIEYADSVLGEWIYTNDARRVEAHKNKAGDCSAFVRECYRRVGVKLGLITSNQYTQGKRIYSGSPANLDMSKLRVGDLVYMHWRNPAWNSGKVTDHVEMMYSVEGQGICVGHPGPGRGPRVWRTTSAYTYFQGADRIWVQRHLND